MGFIVNFPKRRRPNYHDQNDFVAISETDDRKLRSILVWLLVYFAKGKPRNVEYCKVFCGNVIYECSGL